eukprot:m.667759 g.667759  ORF g.667759 m.667759 type:complete len:63 (+) comp22752_c0_seq38:170-358(+)
MVGTEQGRSLALPAKAQCTHAHAWRASALRAVVSVWSEMDYREEMSARMSIVLICVLDHCMQ